MKHLQIFVITLLLSSVVYSEELPSYLCIAEKATGFNNEDDKWEHSKYKPDGKYVIRPYKAGEEIMAYEKIIPEIVLTEFGAEPVYPCKFIWEGNGIMCDLSVGGELEVRLENNRYVRHTAGGYLHPEIDLVKDFSAYIELGTCAKI